MKFDVVIGNPPYQGEAKQQIYTDFYLMGISIGNTVDMIFPTGWQQPKKNNNLSKLNKKSIKEDRQIVQIDNRHNVFPGVSGAEWTNIILWSREYDNGLNGSQLILTDGSTPKIEVLNTEKSSVNKPKEIKELFNFVKQKGEFRSLQQSTSVRKPYGLSTDVLKDTNKYNLPDIQDKRLKEDDIELWTGGRSRIIKYVPKNYPFPKISESLYKYKILVPYAWGNWDESAGLGGAFSNVIIAFPGVATTETWQESGSFNTFEEAQKHAKYLMTKFTRALLYLNKFSQHSTTAWGAVPMQNYQEYWWDLSIEEINIKLFDKYNVPDYIRQFVDQNIQNKTEENIFNF